MAADHYAGYGVSIKADGDVSATLIGGVENQSMAINSQVVAEETAGTEYARQGHITEVKPRGSFSCYSVGAVLAKLGLRGAYLAGGNAAGFTLYQLKRDEIGVIAAGSVHRALFIPNGLAMIRSISASHRQSATVNVDVMSLWDGTNNPLIIAETQAAPTGLDDTHRFSLGSISIGGIAFEGNLSVDIDFGNNADSDGGDSDLYDRNIEVSQILPTITIRGKEVANFSASLGLAGILGTHANTSIQLRRRTRGTGAFSGSADSIKITAEAIVTVEDAFTASGNKRGEMSIKLTCLDDSSNAPLVFDTAFTAT